MPSSGRLCDARCRALDNDLTFPNVSSFFPLERYYEGADKVYESFQQVYASRRADEAYVYGKRYCWFCVDEERGIPSHNYYALKKYDHLRRKHNRQVDRVIQQLAVVKDWMEEEEREREKLRALEEERKHRALEQQRQEKLDAFQRRLERQRQTPTNTSPQTREQIEQSALAKLASLSGQSPDTSQKPDSLRIKQDPSGEEPLGLPSTRYRLLEEDSEDEAGLPPPILPPPPDNQQLPPPPSYQTVASRLNFLGPSKIHPSPAPVPWQKGSMRITVSQLIQQYKQAYVDFHQAGRIRVTPIPSYQGRMAASTNGCTVISALCAAHHLRRDIDTDTIVRIMDQDCVPLLQQIRSKLGLGGGALIIPSDVHDYLVDRHILKQEDFVGAAGGNILDAQHFGSFTKLLAVGEDGRSSTRKAAATLFFREHVVSIVKIIGGGKVRYDLIDSLPGITNNGRPMATRTHCQDLESLEVMLKWYCSRKFSDANCAYIDRNDKWDDSMADFDPRVFQGFVWMPKQ